MNGSAFGSLYYTDCLPGQGLRGGAGFQFQAVSRDVTHDMMTLVQRSTLYEPPVGWMREHRPVEEYPPSLAHAFDDCYVTARGVYLGAEANGVREGNQFTHAVATDDAEAYGMVRPAQLWDAPWWSRQPAPSTECAPVEAEPEVGPWGTDAVRERILGQPDGEEWLTAVYSAIDRVHDGVDGGVDDGVDDAGRQRVLFISADPAAVLCWLAAATLLLPQARAVRVTFRVFATNPRYSEHDVLALHPDWASQFAGTRGDGEFVVFNLDSGTHSPVEPTAAARLWVPRFLRDDPYDVIDAVELAHQFAQTAPQVPAHATRASTSDILASRAVLLGEPATDVRECAWLTAWLAERAAPSGEDVVLPVANAVLAGPADVLVLRELDEATHHHQQTGELATRVRRALIEAEIAALLADTQHETSTEPRPPVAWPDGEHEDVTALVERAADTVEPARMTRLLHTAVRLGVSPEAPRFRTGINRFVQWWADNSAERVELDGLPCGPVLLDQLRDELAHRLRGAGAERAVSAIYDHLWRPLSPTIADPTAPLDSTVAAAAVAQGDQRLRGAVLTTVMGRMKYAMPRDVVDVAWAASFRYVPPRIDELAWFLQSVPDGEVSRTVAAEAYDVVAEAVRTTVSADALDALERLRRRGGKPPAGRLANLTDQSRALRQWLSTIGTTRQTRDAPAVAGLRTVSATVLAVRADEVLDALLSGTTLANAAGAAAHGHDDLRTLLARRLPEVWANKDADDLRRHTAVALAYLTAGAEACVSETESKLGLALRKWAVSNGARHAAVAKLLHGVDPKYVAAWKGDVVDGPLAPAKVSESRSSKVDGKGKPAKAKDEKRPRWRFGHRRGRE